MTSLDQNQTALLTDLIATCKNNAPLYIGEDGINSTVQPPEGFIFKSPVVAPGIKSLGGIVELNNQRENIQKLAQDLLNGTIDISMNLGMLYGLGYNATLVMILVVEIQAACDSDSDW